MQRFGTEKNHCLMWTNTQETADLFKFTKELLKGKPHFLCSSNGYQITLMQLLLWVQILDLSRVQKQHLNKVKITFDIKRQSR